MTTTSKLKFFRNFDKEEAWLNRMAAEGWLLTKAGLRYRFESAMPGAAVVRVDYQPQMPQSDFDDYVSLFQDSGWRHLHGSRLGGPQYFASTGTGPDAEADSGSEIFSDDDSKAQRYRRSLLAHGGVLLMFLVFSLSLWPLDLLSVPPREWYLTEGLWDMQGLEFLGAFLFETIFVIFRVGIPLAAPVISPYCAAVIAYQGVLYRRATTPQVA